MKSPFELHISAPQNENSRHATDLGMDVGRPDLEFAARVNDIYYVFFLELKKKDGKLSPSQITWNERFDAHFACGNVCRDVAYGLQQAKDKFIGWVKSLPF